MEMLRSLSFSLQLLRRISSRSSMKAVLIRTGSSPVQASTVPRSLKIPFSDQNPASPRTSLRFEIKNKKENICRNIHRSVSDAGMIRYLNKISGQFCGFSNIGSRSLPARIHEEDEDAGGSSALNEFNCEDGGFLPEELGFNGGGAGKGNKVGGGNGYGRAFTGGDADHSRIDAHYKDILRSNPGNPILLRNYGRFLHEVEKDVVRAEEYYGRAILASPGDGEVLSLYAKLIWETQRDRNGAEAYFDQAIQASPEDCFVLGSYANFLWDSEGEEEESYKESNMASSSSLVEAF